MAQYTVTITTYPYDRELGAPARTLLYSNLPTGGISPSDSILFKSNNSTYTVSQIDPALWVSAANLTVTSSSAKVITAKAGVTGVDSISITISGYPNKTLSVKISTPDLTPDTPPNLNVTGQNPSDIIRSKPFKVTGINGNATVTISGGWIWAWDGNGNEIYTVTSKTITNGEYLSFGMNTPSTFNSSKSCSIAIGTWSGTWTSVNRGIGDDIEYIPVPYSGSTIKLSDILATFSNPLANPRNLKSFYRAPAGIYVPDIPVNAGVPQSGTIKVSDFIGAKNALYWVKLPQDQDFSWNTIAQGSKTITATWTIEGATPGREWSLGFGDYLAEAAEIRYDISLSSGVSYSVDGGNPGAWSTNNRWIKVWATGTAGREDTYTATITIYVRHPVFPSAVLTKVVVATFFFYGV